MWYTSDQRATCTLWASTKVRSLSFPSIQSFEQSSKAARRVNIIWFSFAIFPKKSTDVCFYSNMILVRNSSWRKGKKYSKMQQKPIWILMFKMSMRWKAWNITFLHEGKKTSVKIAIMPCNIAQKHYLLN